MLSTDPEGAAPELKQTLTDFAERWAGPLSPTLPSGLFSAQHQPLSPADRDKDVTGFGQSQFTLLPVGHRGAGAATARKSLGGSSKDRSGSGAGETTTMKRAKEKGHHRRRSSFELTELDILRLRPFIRAVNEKVTMRFIA
jgi:hypothetical protein